MKDTCHEALRTPKITARLSNTPEFGYRTCHIILAIRHDAHCARSAPANAARPHSSVVHGGASGSLATIAARAAAHGETTVPGPLLDSVEPFKSVPPAPAMPGDIVTAIQSTGLHSETKPPRGVLPTIRRTPNFSPATKSVRTSSAAKRAEAKSKLHPLLQIASESADT